MRNSFVVTVNYFHKYVAFFFKRRLELAHQALLSCLIRKIKQGHSGNVRDALGVQVTQAVCTCSTLTTRKEKSWQRRKKRKRKQLRRNSKCSSFERELGSPAPVIHFYCNSNGCSQRSRRSSFSPPFPPKRIDVSALSRPKSAYNVLILKKIIRSPGTLTRARPGAACARGRTSNDACMRGLREPLLNGHRASRTPMTITRKAFARSVSAPVSPLQLHDSKASRYASDR
jgi:hypothetical protein